MVALLAVWAGLGTPLATADSSDGSPPLLRAAVFARARREMDAGRSLAARADFERSVQTVPELRDHALYHAGHLALEADEDDVAARHFDRLLREHPRSVWASSAATERGEIELRRGEPAAALAHFDDAVRAWEARSRTRALFGKARALEALGRLPDAYTLACELAGAPAPTGRDARILRERLEARGPQALGLGAIGLAERSARARLAEGRPRDALAALPPDLAERGARTLLLRARILHRAGDASGARAAYRRAAASPDPSVAVQALAERARLAWNADLDAEAEADFRLVVKDHPRHEQASEALYALGRIAEAHGRFEHAEEAYDAVARRYPHARTAEESAWRAGFVRYRAGDAAAAATRWQAIGTRDDAEYWAARALERSGRPAEAQAAATRLARRSPWSYYGWWLRLPEPRAPEPRKPPAVSAASVPEAALAHLRRARLLRDLGLRDDALREMSGAENAACPTALLLQEYEALQAHRQVIRLAARLQSQGVRGLERKLRPLAHWPHFDAAGRKYAIDPLLLVSIARQESLFDERIASPANAQGVMQVLPSTASALAGRDVKIPELWDPARNIDLGARYFRQMLDRFDGRAIPAIAAYNAGPSPTERWLSKHGDVPGDEFVELISFRETRGYVKRVLENYRSYRALYADAGGHTASLF